MLKDGFCWGHPAFVNRSVLTNTWFDLHVRGWGAKTLIHKKLRPAIEELKKILSKSSVDRLVCVATSGYRSSEKERVLLRMLEAEVASKVYTLSGEEETTATIEAYLWSRKRRVDQCLFVDQGGGSTELSLLNARGQRMEYEVLPFGTLSSLRGLLLETGSLHEALSRPIEVLSRLNIPSKIDVVASGSALTQCLDVRSNQQQHERVLAKSLLSDRSDQIKRRLLQQFSDVETVKNVLIAHDKKAFYFQNEIKNFLGLQMFLSLLEQIKKNSIRINGAGLRYGIFKQQMLKYYPNFDEDSASYAYLWQETPLEEGKIVEGVISRINRIGIFVRFGRYEGVIHNRKLKRKGIPRPRECFEMKSALRVRITAISKEEGKRRINLSMWDIHGQRL